MPATTIVVILETADGVTPITPEAADSVVAADGVITITQEAGGLLDPKVFIGSPKDASQQVRGAYLIRYAECTAGGAAGNGAFALQSPSGSETEELADVSSSPTVFMQNCGGITVMPPGFLVKMEHDNEDPNTWVIMFEDLCDCVGGSGSIDVDVTVEPAA